MIANFTELLQRTRQHHAIEHATLHLLANRYPGQSFSGYSDPLGFTVAGDVDENALRRAVGDALLRLQAGEHKLARHPNCGTNLVTTAVLVTLMAMSINSRRHHVERFAMTLIGVVPMMVLAKPVGLFLQGYTTSSDVADRWVAAIHPVSLAGIRAHRVIFE